MLYNEMMAFLVTMFLQMWVMINNYNTEVLSEFYIIIFLNKLKILENTSPPPKNENVYG